MHTCVHTQTHTETAQGSLAPKVYYRASSGRFPPTHTHTETSQGILSQKEYYREDSGRLCACMHTHQKLPKVALHKKSTIERVLEVEGRKEQS